MKFPFQVSSDHEFPVGDTGAYFGLHYDFVHAKGEVLIELRFFLDGNDSNHFFCADIKTSIILYRWEITPEFDQDIAAKLWKKAKGMGAEISLIQYIMARG
jgi:hypothetical protein